MCVNSQALKGKTGPEGEKEMRVDRGDVKGKKVGSQVEERSVQILVYSS